jgi:Ca2+-binding RTX toxin-like protein
MSKSFAPRLENLEDRTCMSATLFGNTVSIESGNGNDVVTVSIERGGVVAQRSAIGGVLTPVFQDVVVRENGVVTGRFAASRVELIEYYGNGGNDKFTNKTAIRAYAEGGLGHDTLIGGSVTDEFYGGLGNDKLIGNGGLDYLFGEAGFDRLDGGKDGYADELFGGTQADTFVADPVGIAIFNMQNRDAPQDFNALEGDLIEGMLPPPVVIGF